MAGVQTQIRSLAAEAPGRMRAIVSRKNAAADRNVEQKGLRILIHQVGGILSSVFLAWLCLMGSVWTNDTCVSSPVHLQVWFRGMLGLQAVSSLFFIIMHIGFVTLMTRKAARRRERLEEPAPAPEPDQLPLFNIPCSAAVLILFLTWVLLVWVIIGLIAAVDASFHNVPGECGLGAIIIWYCIFFVFFQMRLCHAWSVKAAHEDYAGLDGEAVEEAEAGSAQGGGGDGAAATMAAGEERDEDADDRVVELAV